MSESRPSPILRGCWLLSALALWAIAIAVTAPAKANEALTPRQDELEAAVRRNDVDTVRGLLADGVEVPAVVLVQAASKAKFETIEALVEGGADVNSVLDLGGIQATALGSAVTTNRADVVGLLLDAGALADTLHLARTPLEWARDGKNPDIIDVLTASSPGASELSDFDALLQAIDDGDHATVRTILESGQDPNEIDEQGNAPIHHAMRKRDDEALRLLLGSGADPDMRDAGDRHPAELAIGFDAGFDELLGASYELQQNRAAPLPEKDKVYEAGTVVGGPCMHTGQIPRDAGCGDSGTEVFIGTRYSTQGWSDSVGPPLCAPITLPPLPGTFKVAAMTIETDWKGDNCYENIGKVYFSKESRSRTSEHTFTVEVNKCPPGTERPIDTEAHDPVEHEGFAGEVQQAFVDALRARGIDAGPEHIEIIGAEVNPAFFRFMLRVSRDGCLLPHMRAIARECIRERSQKGAKHLLVGSIQRAAGKTRVVPRTVVVETGVIESVGKGTSDGTGADAAGDAFGKGLDDMGYESTCAEGVVR